VKLWIAELVRGRVHGIVPFLGVATAIFERFKHVPCSSGFDGRILACPICPEFEWNNLGTIWDGIKKRVEILEPCPSSDLLPALKKASSQSRKVWD